MGGGEPPGREEAREPLGGDRRQGGADDIEKALDLHLNYAARPDGTTFHAPDAGAIALRLPRP